jgi:uncharacterized damage-inducible protein DinB
LTAKRDRIVDQLERAFEGEAWHGPSVLEALEGVTWKKALPPDLTDEENWPTGKQSTRYVLLHGIIQHDLYHAGQISILKKG